MSDEKREQVAKQCEVVRHLADAISKVHDDYAKLLRAGPIDPGEHVRRWREG